MAPVAAVAARTARTREIVHATLETICETIMNGESVSLRNFGTVSVRP
jgi:nucleoid DNA-binding protein